MMRLSLLLSTGMLLAAVQAYSIDYRGLLGAAVAADPTLATLEVAQRQSEVALKRAVATRDRVRWSLQTGTTKLESSLGAGADTQLSASPEASVGLRRGPSVRVGLPFTASSTTSVVTPTVGVTVPLLQAADDDELTVRQLTLAQTGAVAAYQNRSLQVEKDLVTRLIAVFRAAEAVSDANRRLLKAKVELNRAVTLDGAVVGGKAYLDAERAVRLTSREVHRADADYQQRLVELALLTGLPESNQLIPSEVPEVDLSLSLPEVEALPLVRQARDSASYLSLRARESAKSSVSAFKLGGGYELGSSTVDLSSGLTFASDEWTTAVELGWNQGSGARLQVSLAWLPLAPGDAELKQQATSLEVLAQEQAVNQAQIEGLRSLKALELRRAQLLKADENLGEDLQWATVQVARYREWQNKALVTQTELEEVEATAESLRTEVFLQKLDRLAWALDRKTLVGEERD